MNPQIFLKNRIINIISSITLLLPLLASSEELTNVRILGGFSAECNETNPSVSIAMQPITFVALNSKKSGSMLNAEFEIQFVECSKGKWNKLKIIKSEIEQNITDEINQTLKEKQTFSKWRVQIQNTEGKSIQQIPISISSGAKFKFKIKVNSLDIQRDPETKVKFVDVILLADRIKKTSADYFFDEVNWGRVRISLE